jgi:hypothetical protein
MHLLRASLIGGVFFFTFATSWTIYIVAEVVGYKLWEVGFLYY